METFAPGELSHVFYIRTMGEGLFDLPQNTDDAEFEECLLCRHYLCRTAPEMTIIIKRYGHYLEKRPTNSRAIFYDRNQLSMIPPSSGEWSLLR
jgi:hypothetical protein